MLAIALGFCIKSPRNASFKESCGASPEVIDRIEILQGSQSALYGSSAIGGVISLTTKKATTMNM